MTGISGVEDAFVYQSLFTLSLSLFTLTVQTTKLTHMLGRLFELTKSG